MYRSPLAVIDNCFSTNAVMDLKSRTPRVFIKHKRKPNLSDRQKQQKQEMRFDAAQDRRRENEEQRFVVSLLNQKIQYEEMMRQDFNRQVGHVNLSSDDNYHGAMNDAEMENILLPDDADEILSEDNTDLESLYENSSEDTHFGIAQKAFAAHALDSTHQPMLINHEALGSLLICEHPECDFCYDVTQITG